MTLLKAEHKRTAEITEKAQKLITGLAFMLGCIALALPELSSGYNNYFVFFGLLITGAFVLAIAANIFIGDNSSGQLFYEFACMAVTACVYGLIALIHPWARICLASIVGMIAIICLL